jgi:phosphoribosylformylglycinamidine synthase subunit PurS
MPRYRLSIHIAPRRGILDPQGQAVSDALHSLGFPTVHDVRVGRYLVADVDAQDAESARALGTAMCEKLLANPVTEDFSIAAVEPA